MQKMLFVHCSFTIDVVVWAKGRDIDHTENLPIPSYVRYLTINL